jgi:hypothetical protein
MERFLSGFGIHNKTVADKIREQCGFVTDKELPAIIQYSRLQLLLVRCGNGRFLCPAQDVEHFCGIIEKEGSDYVRDVSLPAEMRAA